MSTTNNPKSLLQSIGEAHFLKILVSYVVGAFAFIQFVEWLTQRYEFSAHWPDTVLLFFATMIPSVILFMLLQHYPNSSRIRSMERKLIPINLVLAIAICGLQFFVNGMEPLEAKVMLTDEDGQSVERYVPTSNQTKRMAYFPLKHKFATDQKLLGLSFPYLMAKDMTQDARIFAFNPFDLNEDFQSHSYKITDDVPFSLEQQIANDLLTDYFVTGTIDFQSDEYVAAIKLYTSNTGELAYEVSISDKDYYALIDQINAQVRKQLFTLEQNKRTANYVNLPASEVLTRSLDGLNAFVEGRLAMEVENDYDKALQLINKALEADPQFAIGLLFKAACLQEINQKDEAKEAIVQAMQMAKKQGIPERQLLNVKYNYYKLLEKREKAVALLEMWQQLYPIDYFPYMRLYYIHMDQRNYRKAEEISQKTIDAGHIARGLQRMGRVKLQQGDTEAAKKYFQQFAEQYPQLAKRNYDLAQVYRQTGELEKAKEIIKNLYILNPEDHNMIGMYAWISLDLGEFDQAEALYQEALDQTSHPNERNSVYHWMCFFYHQRGQVQKVRELYPEMIANRELFLGPREVRSFLNWYDHIVIHADSQDSVFFKQEFEKYLSINFPNEADQCPSWIIYNLLFENTSSAEERFNFCEEAFVKATGANYVYVFKGLLERQKSNYAASVEALRQFVESTGSQETFWRYLLAGSLRLNKEYNEAKDIIDKIIVRQPNDGKLLTEAGQIYRALGEEAKAMAFFEQAAKTWEKADATFIPAIKLRKLMSVVN